jgi:hypothetical protein
MASRNDHYNLIFLLTSSSESTSLFLGALYLGHIDKKKIKQTRKKLLRFWNCLIKIFTSHFVPIRQQIILRSKGCQAFELLKYYWFRQGSPLVAEFFSTGLIFRFCWPGNSVYQLIKVFPPCVPLCRVLL